MSASRCAAKPKTLADASWTLDFHNKKKPSVLFCFFLPPFAPTFQNKTAATAAALLARCTVTSCLSASSSCGPFMIAALCFFLTHRKPSVDGIQAIEAASVRLPTWHLSGSSCQAKVGPSLDQTRNRHDRTRSVATPCLHVLTCCARSAAVQQLCRGRGGRWGGGESIVQCV